jgi:hypothetical protein
MIHIPNGARKKLQAYMLAAEEGGNKEEILERACLQRRDIRTVQQAAMCQNVGALDALDVRV